MRPAEWIQLVSWDAFRFYICNIIFAIHFNADRQKTEVFHIGCLKMSLKQLLLPLDKLIYLKNYYNGKSIKSTIG